LPIGDHFALPAASPGLPWIKLQIRNRPASNDECQEKDDNAVCDHEIKFRCTAVT